MYLRPVAFAILAALSFVAPAKANLYINERVGFSVDLPNGWYGPQAGGAGDLPREIYFHDPDANLEEFDFSGVVGVFLAGVDLNDAKVARIDATNFVVTNDVITTQAGFPARQIDGTAQEENGSTLIIRSIAVDPGGGRPILQLVIWFPASATNRSDLQGEIQTALDTFKPI
jgi:hypothetical protein